MQQLSGLENSLGTLFKGLPHLPKDWRHWLADNAWWLALIGVAFGCLGILGLVPVVLGISIFTGIVAGPAAGALIIITGIVNMAVLVISVTLEAMAHRRPVVATTAGGLPDKVRPGLNGWLVPPGDASALAAAISGALGQRDRFSQMGNTARAIVEAEFSWSAAGAAVLRLYDELLA